MKKLVHIGMDKELEDWIRGLSAEEIKQRAELLAHWVEQLETCFPLGMVAAKRINFWN